VQNPILLRQPGGCTGEGGGGRETKNIQSECERKIVKGLEDSEQTGATCCNTPLHAATRCSKLCHAYRYVMSHIWISHTSCHAHTVWLCVCACVRVCVHGCYSSLPEYPTYSPKRQYCRAAHQPLILCKIGQGRRRRGRGFQGVITSNTQQQTACILLPVVRETEFPGGCSVLRRVAERSREWQYWKKSFSLSVCYMLHLSI